MWTCDTHHVYLHHVPCFIDYLLRHVGAMFSVLVAGVPTECSAVGPRCSSDHRIKRVGVRLALPDASNVAMVPM